MSIKQLWCSRGGNFTLMLALTLPVMLGAAGLAVDYANLVRAHHALQSSLDAAILAASHIDEEAISREDMFHDFLDANLRSETTLRNIVAEIEIDEGANYIDTEATVTADVKLAFGFLFGPYRQVSATASAYEATDDLEVALALDNTGSMGVARMNALRSAATALVDILETAKTGDRAVRAALVPFVTAVNVKGAGYKGSWIDGKAKAKYHGANFSPKTNHLDLFAKLKIEWKGCVEARPAPYNFSDAAPNKDVPDTLFVPYFAPDEPGSARKSGDSSSKYNNSYLDDMVEGDHRTRQRSTVKYDDDTGSYIVNGHVSLTNGPNYACPTPILPLTSDFDLLRTEIAKMIHWNGSGTNVSEGLAWAMRVLSPGEPYDQGVDFSTSTTSKFVVVFTDGENNVFGASSEPINKSDYGSYSFVDQGRMGADRSKALTQVNAWTLEICNTLKSQGVEVFTVLLGADTEANRKLYSACASTPKNYYPTSDVNKLEAVFKEIAVKLAQLYVTG